MLTKKPPLLQSFLSLVSRHASNLTRQQYDVIVVGGGHAGTEAAAAAARVGAETLLVTQKINTIGALSCNPSLGGIGKGQLVKEVDALDGLCGRAGDWAGIHFSILNRRKGPAVWGPRAQLDRQRYREFIQSELLSTPRLTVLEGSVEELLVTEPNPEEPGHHRVTGIRLANGIHPLSARSVVLTTGTFLSGSLFVGQNTSPGGRIGDAPSSAGLSYTLKERLGLRTGRLRTGTPPRIVKDSVDLDLAQLHPPDSHPTPFSFLNTHTRCKPEEQLPCYLTSTTPAVERVVRESLHLNCHIQQDTKGPRYCPSIESRVLRFPGRRHQVWLEPEGVTSDLLYPQGLSMTMPPEWQLRLIREIPAMHRAEIHTPGYGVQYDFVCPTQLSPALQVKSTQGLFLAGQINGTTGYEEAAAQGLWAGVNAARWALSMPPVALSRTESYIGVLIDDLVGRGVTEPYRMFTSRAEYRTSLRPDNADRRLTMKGFEEVGCVSSLRYQEAVRVRDSLQDALAALQALVLSTNRWRKKLPDIPMSENKNTTLTGVDMLQYSDVSFEMLASVFPECLSPYTEFSQRLKIEAVYKPHCDLQKKEIERIQKEENMSLPQDIDYFSLPVSLSREVREILDRVRPTTLGAATRLQGITPAAVVNLLCYVRHTGQKERGTHRHQPDQKEEREEELCARNTSLPQ
ncbi:protein MTO1 homolog, mitochondrial [Seriola lalandi dorsalis]|uniref:5-taurinomethyluridine-[tRNA] synthase subunit MTO1, mitochondrial n=1 Tax=Seriola lalandi dorsalis TaxID=1841481 RepID=A0A3B4YIG6_SERLL|nr:protein MTO1 homolog, mitochondrial [Seriola lalandi dorsalis]XP_023258252.1 protein MTO1 homolog, mitochondrial [Seriola lalandi dorsalis]XP_056221958.1 protein MTO1 homolog, mitochondrial [Seriola aureovittata]XP_056221959.1 protein MTO1 homolog, mitochondrial [Seriola aureovittata]